MTPPQTETKKAPALELYGDWLVAAAIGLLVLLFLFKASFAGGSISRLCVLAEWDSVFDAWKTGHAQPYDPSLVQIFLPDYVFLAHNLCKGILPLWNPHCGLGYPFVADIQSSVFSPLRLIFDFFPSLQTYNYYLIGELILAAVSSFFLATKLRLSRIPAAFAAICYTFCPYNLWYLELNLGSSASMFPLIALAFVNAAERRSLGSAILAGLASGLLILSGHPECSFFGITLSSALMFLLVMLEAKHTPLKNLLTFISLLGIAAVCTVAVSAPVLFPFTEYLMNAESYKYGSTYSTPVTWNGIAFNLCNPGQNGASPFLGIIAAMLFPFSFLGIRTRNKNRHIAASILILTAFTFILVSQFGPLQVLFSQAPFTALITRYALPYQLMLLSLLAGIGLSELASFCSDECSKKTKLLLLGIGLIIYPAILFCFSSSIAHDSAWMKAADFDAMLPSTSLSSSAWRRDLILGGIFALVSFIVLLIGKSKPAAEIALSQNQLNRGTLLLAIGLILSFLSETSAAKSSLPLQAKFFYPQTQLIEKLRDEQFRSISTCEYVLRPATNSVYGVNFLTVHNPLFPRRFLEFTKACGAKTDVFNQTFDHKLSKLLNLASVKYILSLVDIEDSAGHTAERFNLSYQSENHIRVYENKNAAPRAYLVYQIERTQTPAASLERIQSSNFDPSKTVVLESNTESNSTKTEPTISSIGGPATGRPSADSANTSNYEAVKTFDLPDSNTVRISTDSPKPAWLVLTDIYYPGWNAYVDGKKTEIERANFAFRAIKLETGKHEIRFAYEPSSFACACVVFIFFVLFAGWSIVSGSWKREI